MYAGRLVLFGMVLLGSVALADAGAMRSPGDPSRDLRHTIAARKMLADDPDLAAWNIGVIVRDRVAHLWGPVPSAEIAFRAEVRVRSMIELADVKNELFVSEFAEPMRTPLKIDNPPQYLPGALPPKLPVDPKLLQEAPNKASPERARPEKAAPAPIQVLPPEVLPPVFDRKRLP
jgi:hypothetical protein